MRSAKQPNLQENPVNSLKNLHIPIDAILQGDSLAVLKSLPDNTLKNYRLMFRGGSHTAVATVERSQGDEVPVLIWRLQPKDEKALDVYEGWPHLYRKETLRVTVNGKRLYAMIYIMNETGHPYGRPNYLYLNTIREGYQTSGFDQKILFAAVADSIKEVTK